VTPRRYPDFSIPRLGEPARPNPLLLPSRATLAEPHERVLADPYVEAARAAFASGVEPASFEIAGPRERIFFDPAKTRAAIATCGGISPGLNDVIRALVVELGKRYGVREIFGVRHGYNGLARPGKLAKMTAALVESAPARGGSILGTSRGTPPVAEIVDTLLAHRIDLFFPVGGDGTLRGALEIAEEAARRHAAIAVVGLPKTIDNDIPWVRRSFGFETAVRTAADSIRAAFGEATSVRNGVGLVKLMGRNAGYLAAAATLASGVVDFCLIPECPFGLRGEEGLLELLRKKVLMQGHAVVVIAEGAGQVLFAGEDFGRDASGNPKLGDIGPRLKDEIEEHFRAERTRVAIKYIDPSYLVRSAPAGTADSLHGTRLAQGAVHAAMSGRTGMLIGYWHGQITHVPLTALRGQERRVNPEGELWWNVLESTGQPLAIG
jgi:6-phosphofructokinase 1